MLKKKKNQALQDLNRNKFLSFVTAAQSLFPGPNLPVKSRQWFEKQCGAREVALTSTQGKAVGP